MDKVFYKEKRGVVQHILGKSLTGDYVVLPDLPGAPHRYAGDLELFLSDDHAHTLQNELAALYQRYYQMHDKAGRSYWFQLGFVPIT